MLKKIASFIVKYRFVMMAVFAVLCAYSVYGVTQIRVEYSIDKYLPQQTDTRKAIDIMASEFTTFGSASVMVKGVDRAQADELSAVIGRVDGVASVSFTSDGYKDGTALYGITFEGKSGDDSVRDAYDRVLGALNGYSVSVPSPAYNDFAATLARDMVIILVLAAVVILAVLIFTSKSFAEVIAFPIVFIVAALLNMGTNYWLGTISFVSNTVCIVLQLALAIDYAIILCHRFSEERERGGTAAAALTRALSRAIPEICSSSLTTVTGLLALACMQLRLGADLGFVLAKSIICSIFTVLLLMPCLLMMLSNPIRKTRHKSFVPKIRFWGKAAVKARYFVPAVFLCLVAVCAGINGKVDFVYSQNDIATLRPTATQKALAERNEIFGVSNAFVVLVPAGDYAGERELTQTVLQNEHITSATGLASVQVGGIYITDDMTYRELAVLGGMNEFTAKTVMLMYAKHAGDDVDASRLDGYSAAGLSLLTFLTDAGGSLPISDAQKQQLTALGSTLGSAKAQLQGKKYSRILFTLDLANTDERLFDVIEQLNAVIKQANPNAVFAGESMSAYDLSTTFESDNIKISLLTVLFIFLILMFTFRRSDLPLLLVAVIQGAIFINFGWTVMVGSNIFFFVYLIATAIQMGATIDYAILMCGRFVDARAYSTKTEAVISAVSGSFPTIITSGTIMTVAAFLIGGIVTEPLIASVGITLGRGTVISVIAVMAVLPGLMHLTGGQEKPIFYSNPLFDDRHSKRRLTKYKTMV